MHWRHTDPPGEDDDDDDWEGEGDRDVQWARVEREDGTTKLELRRCCGTARPDTQNCSVVVRATAVGEEAFVTVHDFLSVVHPWLMALKGDILAAMGTLNWSDEPLEAETALMVNSNGVERLMIKPKAEWISFTRRDPVQIVNISVS